MEYRISDLSKMYNISKEMIRYYVKQGAIHSEREKNNNYRTYSIWDVFEFFEMLQFKEFDISIKNMFTIRNENVSHWLRENLMKYYQKTIQEIETQIMSRERTRELLDRLDGYELNENNFWVRRIPKHYLFHFVSGVGDNYEAIDMDSDVRRILFQPNCIKYLDPIVYFEEKDEWLYSISEMYQKMIPLEILSKARVEEASYCLCTIADMGQLGEFTRDICKPAIEYAKKRGYKLKDPVSGMIITRGVDDHQFKRRMEIRVPISYEL